MVYAESGDFKKAVEWQQKAIDLLPEGEREPARKKLDQYRSDKAGGSPTRRVDESILKTHNYPAPGQLFSIRVANVISKAIKARPRIRLFARNHPGRLVALRKRGPQRSRVLRRNETVVCAQVRLEREASRRSSRQPCGTR